MLKKIWRRFLRHKLGLVGGSVLLLFYLVALFADFLSPYNMAASHSEYRYAPPTSLHFFDEKGHFHFPPFVYGVRQVRDPVTYRYSYEVDKSHACRIRFFVHGETYRFWGLFKTDIHLFGTEPDCPIFLFGTDRFGRDLFSRTLSGARVSLTVGILGNLISFAIGIFVGGLSGYYGGWFDNVVQRLIEVLRSFPQIPLWLALSMIVPPSWSSVKVYFGIVVILSLIGWTGIARVIRGQVLSIKEEDFVSAAKAIGASDIRIIFRHILPNTASYLIVAFTLSFPGMILGESSISFLGLGIKEPMTSWGLLLKEAQNLPTLSHHPWLLIPGAFIVISVLSFNFLGDGLRDAMDPYAEFKGGK